MHVNVSKLRGKIAENGLTQAKIAAMISVNRSTFSRKMRSSALKFSVGEMLRIAEILHLSPDEASQIFLEEDSH